MIVARIPAPASSAFALALLLLAVPARPSSVELPRAFLVELRELLALPNDADDPATLAENVAWMGRAFEARGLSFRDLSEPDYAMAYAEAPSPSPDAPTLLLYFHFDGQPVDPSQWDQEDPYTAVLKELSDDGDWREIPWSALESSSGPTAATTTLDPEWRVFGRSASDAKGPIVMLLQALDRIRSSGQTLTSHLKIVLDGKEEKGSPGIGAIVAKHQQLLASDAILVLDGPADPSNRPTLTYGCRGLARVSLTTFGPQRPEHSGHFGNVAPNPGSRLARVLAGLKGDDGRALVEGFYEAVEITEAERMLIDRLPNLLPELEERFELGSLDAVGSSYHEALQYPSLNIRRLESPLFDGLRTIVPDRARAHIDIRLVPETPGDRQIELLKRHLQAAGYFVVEREPTRDERMEHARIVELTGDPGTPAFQTPPDAPIASFLRQAIREGLGTEPVEIPLMGGTVPVVPFLEALGVPAVIVPVANSDNNQHSPNENLRLGNAAMGIDLFTALLTAER